MGNEEEKLVVETEEETTEGSQSHPETDKGIIRRIKEIFGISEETKEEVEQEPKPKEPEGKTEEDEEETAGETGQKFTKEDLDAAVQAALEEKVAEEREKARLAKLSPEERKAEEDATVRAKNEELSKALEREKLERKAEKLLSEAKLPAAMLPLLDFSDEDKMKSSISVLSQSVKEEADRIVNERLRGKTPKGLGASGNLSGTLLSAEIERRVRGGM